jgi:hypothetical protein
MRNWKEFKKNTYGKKAVLVEGKSDFEGFSLIFSRISKKIDTDFEIVVAGNKKVVFNYASDAIVEFCIVDKDTWGLEEIEKSKGPHGDKVFILPRYCLENYIIVPEEIKVALPEGKREEIDLSEIFKNLEKWKIHAALWRAVTPLWSGLVSLNFNQALLPKTSEIPTEDAIRRKLKEWNSVLDIDKTLERFKQEKEWFSTMNDVEFIKTHVHGKHFFDSEVFPIVSKVYGQSKKEEIKKGLFQNISLPEDLTPIFDKLR